MEDSRPLVQIRRSRTSWAGAEPLYSADIMMLASSDSSSASMLPRGPSSRGWRGQSSDVDNSSATSAFICTRPRPPCHSSPSSALSASLAFEVLDSTGIGSCACPCACRDVCGHRRGDLPAVVPSMTSFTAGGTGFGPTEAGASASNASGAIILASWPAKFRIRIHTSHYPFQGLVHAQASCSPSQPRSFAPLTTRF